MGCIVRKSKAATQAYNRAYYLRNKNRIKRFTSAEVAERWKRQHYQRYSVAFLVGRDDDLIAAIEHLKAGGMSGAAAIRKLVAIGVDFRVCWRDILNGSME